MGHKPLIPLFAILLSGCAATGTVTTFKPVCDALDGPIIYNSRDKNSAYHAGPKLAPQIAEHNSVGVNLDCPAFKEPVAVPLEPPFPKPRPTFLARFHSVWPVWK